MIMVSLLGRLLLLVLLIAAVLLVAKRSDVIRTIAAKQLGMYSGKVAGAHTSMEQEVKSNLQDSAKEAQKKVMQIKIEDIVNTVMRLQKIGTDAGKTKDEVVKDINGLLGR